jgi:two-component system chemotaxis response regulator CheB
VNGTKEQLTLARVVAIGASQGGVEALRTLVSALPRDFPAAVLVVLHTGAERSYLPGLLSEAGELSATHAQNGDTIRSGHVFVAPPDQHLLVTDGRLKLSRGPRENWARPAVDPLFRTAAEVYRQDVAGVVLTGGLNDGTSGLFEIKRRGGVTLVQDPDEADSPSMPKSALRHVAVDYCLPLRELAAQLIRLAEAEARHANLSHFHGSSAAARRERALRRLVEAEWQHPESEGR